MAAHQAQSSGKIFTEPEYDEVMFNPHTSATGDLLIILILEHYNCVMRSSSNKLHVLFKRSKSLLDRFCLSRLSIGTERKTLLEVARRLNKTQPYLQDMSTKYILYIYLKVR